MLSKANRLTRKNDFQKIHGKGRFISDSFLAIKVLSNSLKVARIGFLVGLKVSKKSVVRNKIKRRLRDIFRLLIKGEKLKGGFDVIVLVRPEIVEKKYEEIEKMIKRVLGKAKILNIEY